MKNDTKMTSVMTLDQLTSTETIGARIMACIVCVFILLLVVL
jgi:hypothetical protein